MSTAPVATSARRQETEARLLDAARSLFAETGIGQTKVEAITGRAKVAKGTFFNYFPTRDALLDRLMTDQLGPTLTDLPDDGPLPLRLELLFGLVADTCRADPELARLTLARTDDGPLTRQLDAVLGGWFEAGRTSGELNPELPTETAVALVSAVYRTALTGWLGAHGQTVPPVPRLMSTLDERIAWLFRGIAR